MTTPTPTPGALSAAREAAKTIEDSFAYGFETSPDTLREVALIIDRHTARPDVDALVKALEQCVDQMNMCEVAVERHMPAAIRDDYREARKVGNAALACHAKGGATG